MSYNENFMFFNEGTDAADATGDGALFTSSQFLGANVIAANRFALHFASRNGAATDDTVTITCGGTNKIKTVFQELTAVLSNPNGGMFFQTDFVGEAKNFLREGAPHGVTIATEA